MSEMRVTTATCDICGHEEDLGWGTIEKSGSWTTLYLCVFEEHGYTRISGESYDVCLSCLREYKGHQKEKGILSKLFCKFWKKEKE